MVNKFTWVTVAILIILAFTMVSCAGGSIKAPDELRIATDNLGNEAFDPVQSPSEGRAYLELMYDSLIGTTRDGTQLSQDTGVSKKWDVSPDGTTWTFYLREGIKFHDGTELTAEDVKFSLERLRAPVVVASNAYIFKQLVKDIKVVSPYVVQVILNRPARVFPYYASGLMTTESLIVPKAYMEQQGAENFRKKPIGSGPYKVVEATPGRFKFEAVEKHWSIGVPKFKTIVWSSVPEESTRVAMLKAGEADVISIGRERAQEVEKAGFNIVKQQGAAFSWIHLLQQWKDQPLKDARVREALSIAINRQELIKTIMSGGASEKGSLINPWDLAWEKDVPLYQYDPQRAKQLIREAGYPNGFKLNLFYFPFPLLPEEKMIAESLAGYWSAIGLEIKITGTEWGAFREMWGKQTFPDPSVGLGVISSQVLATTSPYTSSSANYVTKDPEISKLVDSLNLAPDEATYKKTLVEVGTQLRQKTINIPLFAIDTLFATSGKVKTFQRGKKAWSYGILDIVQK